MLVNLVLFKFIDIFVSKMILKYIFLYEKLYDTYTIYEFSDESIVKEICKRVKAIRLSCCFLNKNLRIRRGYPSLQLKE